MYPAEADFLGLTNEERDIIASVRGIIGDAPQVVLEESNDPKFCSGVSQDGTMYQFESGKGWPLVVIVNGTEYQDTSNPQVLGYKFLVFSGSVFTTSGSFSILHNTFRFSDGEILDAYDNSALLALTEQCNLTAEELTVPLISLATGVVLLQGELQKLAQEAIELEDNDSRFNSAQRIVTLQKEISDLRKRLAASLAMKMKCASLNLPVYRVE